MNISRRFSIDQHFCIGHDPVEKQLDTIVFLTLGSLKVITIDTDFIAGFCPFHHIIAPISIFTKALQLPATRYFDGFPFTRI